MNPTVLKPYFSPCVICEIENLSRCIAKCYTNCCETICPLLTSANLCLKQFDWVIVSRELNIYLAIFAFVAFNFGCMIFSVLICWSAITPTFHFVLGLAPWALRSIHPLKKVVPKPFEKGYHLLFARHPLNFFRNAAKCYTLCHLVMMEKRHLNFTLNPKCKLLLVDHVAFVLFVQHLE